MDKSKFGGQGTMMRVIARTAHSLLAARPSPPRVANLDSQHLLRTHLRPVRFVDRRPEAVMHHAPLRAHDEKR